MPNETAISKMARILGRRGGSAKSKAKARSSRANGKLGGRPRKFPRCPRYGAHRFDSMKKRCACGYKPPTAKEYRKSVAETQYRQR